MAASPRPEYCVYALYSYELQVISHPSRHRRIQAISRTVFSVDVKYLHCGAGDSSVFLDMPLLRQVFFPLVVPTVVARVRSVYEDLVGCEYHSLGLLWYRLDRIIC